MMHFANMVLARATLERLSERQVELARDALEGHDVHLDDADRAALLEFARVARAEFGDVPAAGEAETVAPHSQPNEPDGAARLGPNDHA